MSLPLPKKKVKDGKVNSYTVYQFSERTEILSSKTILDIIKLF